ncbi:MAG: ABC transporter permease, partial [Spirochaetaceae bacterium]
MKGSGARAVLELVRKELAQFRRDRLMMVIILVSPVMQLTILGLAANFDLQDMPLVVIDRDGSAESRALTVRFFLGDEFRSVAAPVHERDLERMIDRGET